MAVPTNDQPICIIFYFQFSNNNTILISLVLLHLNSLVRTLSGITSVEWERRSVIVVKITRVQVHPSLSGTMLANVIVFTRLCKVGEDTLCQDIRKIHWKYLHKSIEWIKRDKVHCYDWNSFEIPWIALNRQIKNKILKLHQACRWPLLDITFSTKTQIAPKHSYFTYCLPWLSFSLCQNTDINRNVSSSVAFESSS